MSNIVSYLFKIQPTKYLGCALPMPLEMHRACCRVGLKSLLLLPYLASTAVAFYHQTHHPFFTATTKIYPAFIKFTVDVSHGKNKKKAWTQQPTVYKL